MLDIDKRFVQAFGAAPDIIAAAPGRVNLIGEHIDYSDGFVLPLPLKTGPLPQFVCAMIAKYAFLLCSAGIKLLNTT